MCLNSLLSLEIRFKFYNSSNGSLTSGLLKSIYYGCGDKARKKSKGCLWWLRKIFPYNILIKPEVFPVILQGFIIIELSNIIHYTRDLDSF